MFRDVSPDQLNALFLYDMSRLMKDEAVERVSLVSLLLIASVRFSTVLCPVHTTRDVTEPANICIRWMRITDAYGCGFHVQSPSDSDADLLCDQNYQLF